MSSKSNSGFVKVKDRIPYYGKGIEDLIGATRKILSDPVNKYTQKIILEVGVPYIYMEKMVPEGEVPDIPHLSIHDIIRNHKIEECAANINGPLRQLWDMFDIIRQEELEVNAIAIGDKDIFQKWLGVRVPNRNINVLGIPLYIDGEIPGTTVIVCGAPSRTSDIEDIELSVKVII